MLSIQTPKDESLRLIELFASVQGETSLTGLPTTFIRLASCNLRCTWCDTTYSFGRGTAWPLLAILAQVDKLGCRHVCVTGGEPLLQPMVYPLLKELCDRGYVVSLETGGSLSTAQVDPRVIVILDIKCPGSGMDHKNDFSNIPLLKPHDEIKFVIGDEKDYVFAQEICQRFTLYSYTVLFAPVFGVLNPQDLVAWILRDKLRVRLNLQTHKYIWAPETKGV